MKNIPNELKREVDLYLHTKKKDNDIDLVHEVRSLLMMCGLQQKIPQAFDDNQFIIDAGDKPSEAQRYLLNRYWTQQLVSLSKNTIEERYSLIHDGECKDWLKIFESSVLPTIIEYDLPIVVSK